MAPNTIAHLSLCPVTEGHGHPCTAEPGQRRISTEKLTEWRVSTVRNSNPPWAYIARLGLCTCEVYTTPGKTDRKGQTTKSGELRVDSQWRFKHSKSGGYFGANIDVEGQRLDMYVRNSYTVVNLHDLWINYPRSIWHVA